MIWDTWQEKFFHTWDIDVSNIFHAISCILLFFPATELLIVYGTVFPALSDVFGRTDQGLYDQLKTKQDMGKTPVARGLAGILTRFSTMQRGIKHPGSEVGSGDVW